MMARIMKRAAIVLARNLENPVIGKQSDEQVPDLMANVFLDSTSGCTNLFLSKSVMCPEDYDRDGFPQASKFLAPTAR